MIHNARVCIGWALIHLTIFVLPPGRLKGEFHTLMEQWGDLIDQRLAEIEADKS